ncbi:hypothetical protein LX15_001340 [Streptoalloteichus tenebrarius]|uniref:MFS transporter n=1 Tax=Streptoalloteichus tenebrarius (strain ATCC 17920 / DSM 40477 / JCM 4838 / CBS 697.72 / NBRC 16177 / NCIMB 11028 / NRRL B-12390 / A12253. 1 / ISP 5477) TaxID=1933 RepID=A0ABT1HQ63_STRSD|nr:hypothetical protein [Streptoalloteichus tenebrarius]MCP2257655.1 hypothetical protein [Streptoalloteichus tenebrarius]BFE98617.1 hypothetical protein GCM10020241_02930 [Streptoalloteichus tenebrarius]
MAGVLLARFWWGAAFLVPVPAMALLLVLGPLLLPESRGEATARLDLPSAALSLAAVLPVVYGLTTLATHGWAAPPVLAIAGGTAVTVAFARRQRRVANPLIDPTALAAPASRVALGVNVLAAFGMVGSTLLTSQHLQLVAGASPLAAGLWTLPGAVAAVAGATTASALARRAHPAIVIAAGLALATAAFGTLTLADTTSGVWPVVAGGTLMGAGLTMTLTSTASLVIGAAGGLVETSEKLGSACGAALLGALHAARYRAELAATAPPHLPADLAATARETLGAALTAADRLPTPTGEALRLAAQQAFVSGTRVAMLVCLALFTAATALAPVLLRRADRHP